MYNARFSDPHVSNRCRAVPCDRVILLYRTFTITISVHRVKCAYLSRITVVRRQLPSPRSLGGCYPSFAIRKRCEMRRDFARHKSHPTSMETPKQTLSVLGFSIRILSLCTNVISSAVLFSLNVRVGRSLHGVGGPKWRRKFVTRAPSEIIRLNEAAGRKLARSD